MKDRMEEISGGNNKKLFRRCWETKETLRTEETTIDRCGHPFVRLEEHTEGDRVEVWLDIKA